MEPSSRALAHNRRAESAEDVRFGEKPHEWQVTRQYHTVSARVTIERPVVETRPISPHNLATVRGISQGRSAKIGVVFRLPRLAPRGLHWAYSPEQPLLVVPRIVQREKERLTVRHHRLRICAVRSWTSWACLAMNIRAVVLNFHADTEALRRLHLLRMTVCGVFPQDLYAGRWEHIPKGKELLFPAPRIGMQWEGQE